MQQVHHHGEVGAAEKCASGMEIESQPAGSRLGRGGRTSPRTRPRAPDLAGAPSPRTWRHPRTRSPAQGMAPTAGSPRVAHHRLMSTPTPIERVIPAPGQESVWDYPRPPRVEPVPERIRVVVDGVEIANSTNAVRVLETAGAPVYYVPPVDIRMDLLHESTHRTFCEWKGTATYHTLRLPSRDIPNVAWSYPDPDRGYEVIRDHLAFYAWKVDEAWVGDELATPQPGHFYGGWVTSRSRPVQGRAGERGLVRTLAGGQASAATTPGRRRRAASGSRRSRRRARGGRAGPRRP